MNKQQQLELLKAEGFTIPNFKVVKGKDITYEGLLEFLKNAKATSPFMLDGIVLDIDSDEIKKTIPRKNSQSDLNPVYAKKFKANVSRATTEVVAVHWNISKQGYLKPRIEIKPVELSGVTVTFATGFNAKFVRDNNIGPGAVIQITRSGDVIPFIEKVIQGTTPALPIKDELGPMFWSEGEVDLVLENDTNEAKLRRLLELFVGIEVPHLRRGNMEKLFEAGYTTPEAIILADETSLKTVIGESAGSKIYNGIKEKLNPVPLWKLAGASQMFGRGIGRRKMKKLADAHGDILGLTLSQIQNTEGFDVKTAEVVYSGLPVFKKFLEAINGFYSEEAANSKPAGGELAELVICFTGVRNKDLEQTIEQKGGTIASGVNAKTTHLVAKDPNGSSSKLQKARELGIEIIDLPTAETRWL